MRVHFGVFGIHDSNGSSKLPQGPVLPLLWYRRRRHCGGRSLPSSCLLLRRFTCPPAQLPVYFLPFGEHFHTIRRLLDPAGYRVPLIRHISGLDIVTKRSGCSSVQLHAGLNNGRQLSQSGTNTTKYPAPEPTLFL
jgi:hypothetical protein